jgi:arylsulfatase A-like enzyme
MNTSLIRLLFLLVIGVLALCPSSGKAARPNILFIVVDDLRPELGAYGKSYIKSPNINSLAKAGMVFTHAYVQQAVCSPSRTSVMTGMRPDTTKIWDLKTHFRTTVPNAVTLPQLFKDQGYFTQGLGKIYHNGLNDPHSWSVPWWAPSVPDYVLPQNFPPPNSMFGAAYEAAVVPDNTYRDGKVAERAVATLRELSKKPQPFFLAVGFVRPHLPFAAPKKYWNLYNPATIALAPNPFRPKGAPGYAILPLPLSELYAYRGIPKSSIPAALARTLKHGYYASVSYTDAQVGKVLNEVARLGLRQNTIVALWGDHGWKLGEHDGWSKHSNVENDVLAPLIVSIPGMSQAGRRSDRLVEFVDIYPTLAELAGLPLPADLEGKSFAPLLNSPNLPWKTAAFSQFPRYKAETNLPYELMGYSMRTDRYRFTVWVRRADHSKIEATELYDRSVDPQENNNIANNPAKAETVKRLMEQWRKGWRGALPPLS